MDDNENKKINMDPSEFSQSLLDMMPVALDQNEQETCKPKKRIGGEALFVGLLRTATAHNNESAIHERRAAVLHPAVFVEALQIATQAAKEMARKKLMKDKTPMIPIPQLTAAQVIQSVAYANNCTELFIPMLVQGGSHWILGVVKRSTVEVVIYDSLEQKFNPKSSRDVQTMAAAKKVYQEQIKVYKEAVRKILVAIQEIDAEDRTTMRFKIRYQRSAFTNLQSDAYSCGIFSIIHAERSLFCRNSNLKVKADEPKINLVAERKKLMQDFVDLRARFIRLADNNTPLAHAPNTGQKQCKPGKARITVRYCGKH